MVQDYKQLKIWRRSFQLVVDVYKLTNKFPKSEKYNLTSQLRRAATSISSNIAEGASKPHEEIEGKIELHKMPYVIRTFQVALLKNLIENHQLSYLFNVKAD